VVGLLRTILLKMRGERAILALAATLIVLAALLAAIRANV
jgi:hypothetical protein